MATYTIWKSAAYPKKEKTGEEIALQAVRHQSGHPQLWGHIEGRDGRMDPCCTNAAWTSMMRLSEGDEKNLATGGDIEWLARPSVLIETFKGRNDTIHVVCLSIPVAQEIESGPDTTVFLMQNDFGLYPLVEACGTRTSNNEIFVNLKTFGLEYNEYKFGSDDPAWPWPVVYPQKFIGLIQLGTILLKEDANPLTGLCRASDGAYRSLAKALAGNLSKAYKQIARDIVSYL